jgi:hypothetical protein
MKPGARTQSQIQDDFRGVSLSRLSKLKSTSEVYGLVPSFEEECPCCGGRRCAERLGGVSAFGADGAVWSHSVAVDSSASFPVSKARAEAAGSSYFQCFAGPCTSSSSLFIAAAPEGVRLAATIVVEGA